MLFTIEGLPHLPQSDDRATVFAMASGKTLAIPSPPVVGEVSRELHDVAVVVRLAASALAALEKGRRAAVADKTLSDLGRAKATEALQAAAESAAAEASGKLEGLSQAVTDLEGIVFGPPLLEPTDVVAGLQDLEIRNHLRELPSGQQGTQMAAIGKNHRLLQAVVRSPVPLPPFSEHADRLWRDIQSGAHPRSGELARLRAAVAWGKIALPSIARHI